MKDNSKYLAVALICLLLGVGIGWWAFSSHTIMREIVCDLDDFCKEQTGFDDARYSNGYCIYGYEDYNGSQDYWWNTSWKFRQWVVESEIKNE